VVGKNEQGEMTFDVSKAKFAKDVKFKDLLFGDKILIQYRTKDGKNMATSLDYAPGVMTEKTQGEGVDDSWITTKVKSMLAGDASLNPFKIHVETIKGNVQLTGTVDSKKAADKAVQITKSVKGVKSVKSNLIVK
jgi:osmotically-inducible protein OsmY